MNSYYLKDRDTGGLSGAMSRAAAWAQEEPECPVAERQIERKQEPHLNQLRDRLAGS